METPKLMDHNYKDILHNVDLTEGQISIILNSLESYTQGRNDTEYIKEVDTIFETLEGTVDRFYYKLEENQSKFQHPMWTE